MTVEIPPQGRGREWQRRVMVDRANTQARLGGEPGRGLAGCTAKPTDKRVEEDDYWAQSHLALNDDGVATKHTPIPGGVSELPGQRASCGKRKK